MCSGSDFGLAARRTLCVRIHTCENVRSVLVGPARRRIGATPSNAQRQPNDDRRHSAFAFADVSAASADQRKLVDGRRFVRLDFFFQLKRHASVSNEETQRTNVSPLNPAKDYVESLHQNAKSQLIYGKNNVLVQPVRPEAKKRLDFRLCRFPVEIRFPVICRCI